MSDAKHPADPMEWPLPCDVKVGHGTIKKGCPLSALVARMQVLHDMAQPLTEGFVQVPVSALMELKADVNTLACLSLKAERWQKGAQIKTTIAGLIDGIGQGDA